MAVIAQKRTEKEYRALELDSYSSLALFAKDRRQYYKKYIKGEDVKEDEEESKAVLIGTLVETLELEGREQFDNKFYASLCNNVPTPKQLDFVNALYKRCIEYPDGKEMIELMRMAYDDANIKKPGFKLHVENFSGSEDELYFREMLLTKPKKLSIVTLEDMDNAEKIVQELNTNPITAEIMTKKTDEKWKVFNQLQIEGFDIGELVMKSMIDKLIVDVEEKVIDIYDLKCVWNVEGFYENYYLYRRAYIQAYVYYYAIAGGFVNLGFDYSEYTINPPKFIVCDSINYFSPLIYETTEKDLEEAVCGFEYKGRKYTGVLDIIRDLKWAKDNNKWRISRENAEIGGIIKLKKEG